MIYLASASPRRQELLQQIGLEFEAVPSQIDEVPRAGEPPTDYVLRVAEDKARAVANRLRAAGRPAHPVLAADTEVVIDGDILGKPRDRLHAREMLRRLAGRSHTVLTALCVVWPSGSGNALSESRVTFADLSETEIDRYLDSGEADDKAGGYAIQGRAGAFIRRLEGSYSGVMGLPLYELRETLRYAGVERI